MTTCAASLSAWFDDGFGSRAVGREIWIGWGLPMLQSLGPGHHDVDVATAALGADEPIAPLGNGGLGAEPLGDLGSIGLAR